MEIKVSVGVGSRYSWPNGKPVSSEALPDGRTKHTLENGRIFTVSRPTYVLDYLSTWMGGEPDETYSVQIAIAGLSAMEGFYEVWNFDTGQARNYAFHKTARITHIGTGNVFTGEELEKLLRSQTEG
ncbi:hypothetical protein RY831_27170 [Noviherbaspirillum sp. CPCC 100848]|uniref:Uncharacterized protein n=1 Tax=Noviherbaspirillum album TaxID=3080276 RepID=A0ABU6JGQ9_9BURK|nr:hypothetical protein [Noviherbaspirillum sp. CPCC 100848]MEC4722846.1 hypothetical protein [Noviherbaspirillum sp. CPCC 100848]